MEENYNKIIKQFSNEKLCEIIVSNRYLGIFHDEAIVCMEELALRRANGDSFSYEKKIDELLSILPKINLDLNQLIKNNKLGKII